MKIAGSRVLITGGGSGIGRFLVERLDADSAEICVLELDAVRCTELAEAFGGRVKAWPCDVTDPAAVEASLRPSSTAASNPMCSSTMPASYTANRWLICFHVASGCIRAIHAACDVCRS